MTTKENKLNSFYKRECLLEATASEKIAVLKEKMKILFVGTCKTLEEELAYLEYAYVEGI